MFVITPVKCTATAQATMQWVPDAGAERGGELVYLAPRGLV